MTEDGRESATVPESTALKRRPKREKRELRVAFDTNVLYTGSASDLVRQEAANLITQSTFPDLEVAWYLPEVVRHERQFQMRKGALNLLPSVAKVERLLGHNLNITEEILIEHVDKAVAQRQMELRLVLLKLDYSRVDWDRLVLDALYRRPPFQEGKTEKGFRDALVVESFIQLAADSPRSSKVCRLVLVTEDALVAEVNESFVAALKPKAQKLFIAPEDVSTLYYKERVQDRLKERFKKELSALPPGATGRRNGAWRINPPNFAKKTRQRVHWISRIQIEGEATRSVTEGPRVTLSQLPAIRSGPSPENAEFGVLLSSFFSPTVSVQPSLSPAIVVGGGRQLQEPGSSAISPDIFGSVYKCLAESPSARTVTTHRGIDAFEVFWSVDVTMKLELRRPSIRRGA